MTSKGKFAKKQKVCVGPPTPFNIIGSISMRERCDLYHIPRVSVLSVAWSRFSY
jgi:hypothetical protein